MHRFKMCAALALAATVSMAAQTLASAAKPGAPAAVTQTWTQPRTPDGQPDLQGVWTNSTLLPMERPKELGAKEFFTEQEAAEFAKKGFQGDRAALPDAHYDMGQYGLDPNQSKFAPNLRTSLIVGPEGRVPPYTPGAQKRLAANAAARKGHEFDTAQNRPLSERCIMWPVEGPPMLSSTYNNNIEIVQGPGYVAILSEMIHDVRMIPLDGRPHVSENIRLWRGDSRGRWEGNTLVIDTTNFTDKTAFRGSTEKLHVVERISRPSQDVLLYEFTVEDPTTWTKPWSAQIVMPRIDGAIFEYACHEANRGVFGNLGGARAEEKAAGK